MGGDIKRLGLGCGAAIVLQQRTSGSNFFPIPAVPYARATPHRFLIALPGHDQTVAGLIRRLISQAPEGIVKLIAGQ